MFTHIRSGSFLILIGLVLATDVFAAERIWDNELKRYLTEEEVNHAEVFMTEEDAVKMTLPKSERIRKAVIRLNHEKKDAIEQRIGWKFPEESFELYIGETGDKIDGYAMVHNTIGKHKHMTYMVGVDSRGACTDVELLVFREAKGSEVGRKRFNAQYEGKTVSDPIRINKDIINISGATMSVRSINAGVKRVLVLVDEFYLKPAGLGSDTVAVKKSEQGIFGSIFGN
ncbi:MAG: FMN-binding protein [Nitrospira sp. CG24C]|nr:MAG: FMN-binding protein [Nitrospira sp. CG24C]TKB52166.1 MAG: FMN-binding protein [Nitrospira sp.]